MNDNNAFLIYFTVKMLSMVSLGGLATYMIFLDKHGWGWLIFLAALISLITVEVKD